MGCHGCGVAIGDSDRFCNGCGMPQQPKKTEGTKLNATKFRPSGGASSSGGSSSGGGGGSSGGGGSAPAPASSSFKTTGGGNSSGKASGPIIGTFEYVKPADKNTQTLVLRADGSVAFSEVGETTMEKWSSKGHGTWSIINSPNGEVVQINLVELKKEMIFKIKTNVKGIEDGVSVQNNVGLPIFYQELAEAKAHGAHKWRRKN